MIGSDFCSNCLERLSADDTNRQRFIIWELDTTLSMYGYLSEAAYCYSGQ